MALHDALLLDPAPFEAWIAKRTDGIAGSGTFNDPWDGSTTTRLDSILSQLPGNAPMMIHLGPGTFTTKGYTDDPTVTPGWEIKAGLKIVGAGIGVTTLTLAPASPAVPAQFFAVGHRLLTATPTFNPVDLCEVSDSIRFGSAHTDRSPFGDQLVHQRRTSCLPDQWRYFWGCAVEVGMVCSAWQSWFQHCLD